MRTKLKKWYPSWSGEIKTPEMQELSTYHAFSRHPEVFGRLLTQVLGIICPAAGRSIESVVVESGQDFQAKMDKARIPCLPWIDKQQVTMDSVNWVQHTAFWSNRTSQQFLSKEALQDMRRHDVIFQNEFQTALFQPASFAEAYASGNFTKMATLLSVSNEGIESWPSIAMISNAYVFPEGQVVNDTVSLQTNGCGPLRNLSRICVTDVSGEVPRFNVVATIAHFWGHGYYHFVAENLVRLPLILDAVEGRDEARLHVIDKKPKFVIPVLEAFGLHRSQIIDGWVTADLVLVPEPVHCNNPSAVTLHLLRQSLTQLTLHSVRPPSARCRMLVVKRRKNSCRSISNHNELISSLTESFPACSVDVHTGARGVVEQLRMFRRSTVIIASHGAGLANMIACRERTVVMEFVVAGADMNICYMNMALKLMLNYAMLTVHNATHGDPMTVDVQRSVSFLKSILSESQHSEPEFEEMTPCKRETCGPHEWCSVDGQCICKDGFFGSQCESFCDPETSCHDRGFCDGASCACFELFAGESCEECRSGYFGEDCTTLCNRETCGQHGRCGAEGCMQNAGQGSKGLI